MIIQTGYEQLLIQAFSHYFKRCYIHVYSVAVNIIVKRSVFCQTNLLFNLCFMFVAHGIGHAH